MSQWRRVRRGALCPICGHDSWCSVSEDGAVVRCMRTQNDHPSPAKDGSLGWLHANTGAAPLPPITRSQPTIDAPALHRRCVADLSPDRRARLARELGVSYVSLKHLGLGWHVERGCYTFPMRDAERKIIGLRTRHPNGSKRCIPGSHNGLFLPTPLKLIPPVYLVEGPTDCAALLDWGYSVIGRPQAWGGHQFIIDLLNNRGVRPRLIVEGDNDPPDKLGHSVGRDSAFWLRDRLMAAGFCAEVTFPPDRFKDIREWHNSFRKETEACPIP